VLELAAGTGLPGLTAAAVHGAASTLTDKPALVPLLQRNAQLNSRVLGRGSATAAALLFGGRMGRLPPGCRPPFNLVLASDALGCADAGAFPALVKSLRDVLAAPGGGGRGVALLSYRARAHWEAEFFALLGHVYAPPVRRLRGGGVEPWAVATASAAHCESGGITGDGDGGGVDAGCEWVVERVACVWPDEVAAMKARMVVGGEREPGEGAWATVNDVLELAPGARAASDAAAPAVDVSSDGTDDDGDGDGDEDDGDYVPPVEVYRIRLLTG
jgi:hypothetical protein